MSLFGDLPPALRKRSAEAVEAEQAPADFQDDGSEPSSDYDEPSPKRARAEEDAAPQPAQRGVDSAGEDQIVLALQKITSHISSSSKFTKASPLLRQLLDSTSIINKAQRCACFEALKAAFKTPDNATQALLRKEYLRLMMSVDRQIEIFRRQERTQIDVYKIWAVLQNEMHTDDSFTFNKVIIKLKGLIQQLPEADETDDIIYSRVTGAEASAPDARGSTLLASKEAIEAGRDASRAAETAVPSTAATSIPAPSSTQPATIHSINGGPEAAATAASASRQRAAGGPAEEDDPFGLGALMGPVNPPAGASAGQGARGAAGHIAALVEHCCACCT